MQPTQEVMAVPPCEQQDSRARQAYDTALSRGESVAVVRVAIDSFERLRRRFGDHAASAAQSALDQHILEHFGTATAEGPRDQERVEWRSFVVTGRPLATLRRELSAFVERVRRVPVSLPHRGMGITASVGLGHDQCDVPKHFETLRQVATEGLLVAQGAGGDRACETDVHRLVHRRLVASGVVPAEGSPIPAAMPKAVEVQPQEAPPAPKVSAPGPEAVVSEPLPKSKLPKVADWEKEMAFEAMRSDLDRNLRRKDEDHQREVEVLRRRIDKLNRELDNNESVIAKLVKQKRIDPGLASIHRVVQGLCGEDNLYEQKKEMLSAVYEANLDIQGQIEVQFGVAGLRARAVAASTQA